MLNEGFIPHRVGHPLTSCNSYRVGKIQYVKLDIVNRSNLFVTGTNFK